MLNTVTSYGSIHLQMDPCADVPLRNCLLSHSLTHRWTIHNICHYSVADNPDRGNMLWPTLAV